MCQYGKRVGTTMQLAVIIDQRLGVSGYHTGFMPCAIRGQEVYNAKYYRSIVSEMNAATSL